LEGNLRAGSSPAARTIFLVLPRIRSVAAGKSARRALRPQFKPRNHEIVMTITILEGDAVRALGDELTQLCEAAFDSFDPAYLTGRLAGVSDPCAVLAYDGDGALTGFKLGYRRGGSLFYSWLGAVHPSARRQGLASALMARQHDWAAKARYSHVETRTRAGNTAMIVLNLKSGFVITGFETDRQGIGVVTQRKSLPAR
jgi:GNAT superfamily N-acetyltransferase